MDPPPFDSVVLAYRQLYLLSALDKDGKLTDIGRRMAALPLEPIHGKLILEAERERCSDEMVTIVSMLSAEAIFGKPSDPEAANVNALILVLTVRGAP